MSDIIEVPISRIEKISVERVEDLIVGAFEGGSNYWYSADIQRNEDNQKTEYYKLPFIEGCSITIWDAQDNTPTLNGTPKFILDKDAIEKGLKIMAKRYDWHFKNFIDENDDSTTADAFLQCCVFGDIIFG